MPMFLASMADIQKSIWLQCSFECRWNVSGCGGK